MKEIIWKNDDAEMYLKFKNDVGLQYQYPTPSVSFILGVELNFNSWLGRDDEIECKGAESFNLIGEEFLKDLEDIVNNYHETTIKLGDNLGDTDGFVLFECLKDRVVVRGQLGNSIGSPFVSKFQFEADSGILQSLYDNLKANFIY